ncbi:hypothetical protein M8C21_016279, partial [Ambrosia artemisiifolia]
MGKNFTFNGVIEEIEVTKEWYYIGCPLPNITRLSTQLVADGSAHAMAHTAKKREKEGKRQLPLRTFFSIAPTMLVSVTLLASLMILLRSATRITHKAQGVSVTCLAAKWHVCATIDVFESPEADTETPPVTEDVGGEEDELHHRMDYDDDEDEDEDYSGGKKRTWLSPVAQGSSID